MIDKKYFVFIFIGLLFTVSPVILAQQVVSGRITDASDGSPVPGASIYIANTTIGTASGVSGEYSLTVSGTGSIEIVVSHVGYLSVFHKIDTPQDFHQFNVVLKINELQEITINAPKTYKKKDVDLFWRTILGEKPAKNGMEVLNPEKVYYYLSSDNILKASCQEPIEIVNHKTGYHIRYVLQSFEYDYREKEFKFSGMPYFENLTPQNSRQKERWEKKRQEVFATSINRFIRALYQGKIHEEGFVLVNKDLVMKGKTSPVLPKDIIQAGQDKVLVTVREPLFLIGYERPFPEPTISYRDITAKGETYPVVELLPQQFVIYPDGTYQGTLKMIERRNSIFGIVSKLPVDYADLFARSGQTTLAVADNVNSLQGVSYMDVSYTPLRFYDIEDVRENMTAQIETYPQEKIHLHTDRDFYVTGEKIWFKAYLTDAATYLFPTNSRYVYAELIDSCDSLINRVMIRPENGMYYGNLFISEIVQEGNYTLRAYTQYMENLGDDYFFKKNIRIGSKGINPLVSKNRGNGDDFEVSFFPEGGNLVEDAFCKVAFKSLNRSGYAETIYGEIVDGQGTIITTVQTYYAGMGVFSYVPASGKRYFLKCRNENGIEKQFELPQPEPRARVLAVSQRNGRLSAEIRKSPNSPDTPTYLLAHNRGMVFHFSALQKDDDLVILPDEVLPGGIIQLILFDEQMNPLSERLIFNKNDDYQAEVEFKTDKIRYGRREKVVATLFDVAGWYDGNYNELADERRSEDTTPNRLFNLSVAVTDDKDIAVDESNTILSTLLLSSELKGYIENPAYYLQDNIESATALDYLMLTHGWRRYNIPEVVKGNYESPEIPFQESMAISGKVKSLALSRPVSDGDVFVLVNEDYDLTSTDETGTFAFRDFEYPDSTSYFIQALNRRGSNNVEIVIDSVSFPRPVYALQNPSMKNRAIKEEDKCEPEPDAFIAKAGLRSQYDEEMRVIQLSEVEVTAPRIDRKDEPRLQYWANMNSDITLRREEIMKTAPRLVSEWLRHVPGVEVSSMTGEISIRQGMPLPLVLIDGAKVDWPEIKPDEIRSPFDTPLETVSVHDVESIDVIKGAGAAIFGTNGAGGVISITTKRGIDVMREVEQMRKDQSLNYSTYTTLGYQKPVEFYAPRYETLEAKYLTIPDYRTTIFWKPDIVVSEDGKATFDFYTSDFPTTYSVVIEGLTTDGSIIRQVEKIMVDD